MKVVTPQEQNHEGMRDRDILRGPSRTCKGLVRILVGKDVPRD